MAKTLDHEAKVFYESDCNLGLLKGKTIAIIGSVHKVTLTH